MGDEPDIKKFDKLLIESVEEALDILGESTKRTLLYFLRQSCKVESAEEKTAIIIDNIRELFGEAGSSFLESRIIRILYEKVGLEFSYPVNIREAIENARKTYLQERAVRSEHGSPS